MSRHHDLEEDHSFSSCSNTDSEHDASHGEIENHVHHRQLRSSNDDPLSDDALSEHDQHQFNNPMNVSPINVAETGSSDYENERSNSQQSNQENENGDPQSSQPDIPHLQPENDWHPFKSRVHCQLVLLYHGSHRRNIDLVTFRAFMEILEVSFSKIYSLME